MGKRLAVLLTVVLLWGCSATEENRMDEALAFRAGLQGAGGCTFAGEITADYGDQVYTCAVTCTTDGEGNLTFCLTAPETIAGITGTVSAGGGALTFDGTALAFSPLADGMVSPVAAPYVVAESWRQGYITAAGPAEDGLRLTVDTVWADSALTVDTWLEKNIPVFAEVCYNGQRILTIRISEFQYNT